jgi:hypothetical protein
MGGTYKAPDMAAANREAVYAQAETFPIIRELESASRLGTKGSYVLLDKDGNPRIDPKTGKTQIREYDFSGQGDVDLTRQIAQVSNELADPQAAAQLAVAQKYGTQFAQQRKNELETLDPKRYALYENFLQDLKTGTNQIPEDTIESPSYERVGMPSGPQDTGEAARIRSNLERQISSGLAQAGTLDPAMIRGAEQAARARGTSTGNLLGNLSAFREARAVNEAISNADVQRRQQAIGLLQSGQTSSDVANRQAQEAFQNILAATGQRNTAMQQSFAGQMASQQQRQGTQQQNIANIQSALGLQPIVGQAAQLGNLQQGASPFAPPQYIQGMQQAGPGQLLQTGSSFALQNAQNDFQASQAGSPLAILKGVTSAIGSLGSAAIACHVARECIPDQWEAFYFWKELVGPKWFKSFYDSNAEKFAKWLKDKPKAKKLVANWMIARINSIIPKN